MDPAKANAIINPSIVPEFSGSLWADMAVVKGKIPAKNIDWMVSTVIFAKTFGIKLNIQRQRVPIRHPKKRMVISFTLVRSLPAMTIPRMDKNQYRDRIADPYATLIPKPRKYVVSQEDKPIMEPI